MTQHLNYCRQFLSWIDQKDIYENFYRLLEYERGMPSLHVHLYKKHCERTIEKIKESVKFILPENAQFFEKDFTFKAINEGEDLRLPFPVVVLEFARTRPIPKEFVGVVCSKGVTLLSEIEDEIELTCITKVDNLDLWLISPPMRIPMNTTLSLTPYGARMPDTAIINPIFSPLFLHGGTHEEISENFGIEVEAMLGLINALSCSNVSIEKSCPPSKLSKGVKGRRPFDTYHILTINANKTQHSSSITGGSHNSPREHLRRGHIRRLDTKSIWVNACVVSAGKGPKIDKSYRVI